MNRSERNIELGKKLGSLADTFVALGLLEQIRKLGKDERRILRNAQAQLRRIKNE